MIRWLAIARKHLAAYPSGHPALATAFRKAHEQLKEFLGSGGPLRLSVLRQGLLWEDQKVASAQALDLAQALYRRDVAILEIDAAIDPRELEALLRVMSTDPRRTGETSLAELLAAQEVRHARLGMVNFESIRLTSRVQDHFESEEKTRLGWGSLIGSLQSARDGSPEAGPAAGEVGAEEVAAFIRQLFEEERASPAAEVDLSEPPAPSRTLALVADALSDYASKLRGEEIRGGGRQIARLISLLPEELRPVVLSAAIRAFSASPQVSQDLRELDAALARNSALEALTLPPAEPPVRLPAPPPAPPSAPPPPAAGGRGTEDLESHLRAILGGEDVDRFHPDLSATTVEQLGSRLPEAPLPEGCGPDLGDRPESLAGEPVLESLAQTISELLNSPPFPATAPSVLKRVEIVFRSFLESGLLEPAVGLIEDLRGKITDPRVAIEVIVPIQECLERLASPETAAAILERLPLLGEESLGRARDIILALGAPAIRCFLAALVEEKENSRRRRILDFVISLGPALAPEARALLTDSRWFVTRNMIYLLRSVGDRTSLPEVRRCVSHSDIRVRLEAIKTIYAFDPSVPRDLIWKTVLDPDPKTAETAVMFAGSYSIAQAVDPILSILKKWDPLGRRRSLRLQAIESLGELGEPRALPEMKRYFRNWLFPVVAREERVAAYRSLEGYPEEARKPLLELGSRSRIAEIRETCRRLATAGRPAAPARARPGKRHG